MHPSRLRLRPGRAGRLSWGRSWHRRADLLPVEYFHVVFSLPQELRPLALYRPRVLYGLLFRAAADTLATFAADPRHFEGNQGGTLGITAVLHTWGQNLSLHPHLYWLVYAKPPFAGPESVLACPGTYTHRIAISNHRITSLEGGRVSFRCRDDADDRKIKIMHLNADEFIRRFLLHVLPKGFVRIRHYGLLANRTRKKKIARCRALLSVPEPQPRDKESIAENFLRIAGVDILGCPVCHQGRMRVVADESLKSTDRAAITCVTCPSRSATPHDNRNFSEPRHPFRVFPSRRLGTPLQNCWI